MTKGKNTIGLLPRNQNARVIAPGLFQNVLGNEDIDRHPAAHGQRISGLESDVRAVDLRTSHRAAADPYAPVKACARSFPAALSGRVDMSFGMIDRHRPVVAGDVPVELVVIFEITDAVADNVVDLHRARGVDGVRDIDFQIAVVAGSFGFVLQLLSGAVGDGGDIQKQGVVRASRAGIFDRDGAMNAVPLADKDELDALLNQGGAISADRDDVLKVGNPPALCKERERQDDEASEEQKLNESPQVSAAKRAPECSPRRKPWVKAETERAPKGRKSLDCTRS